MRVFLADRCVNSQPVERLAASIKYVSGAKKYYFNRKLL